MKTKIIVQRLKKSAIAINKMDSKLSIRISNRYKKVA